MARDYRSLKSETIANTKKEKESILAQVAYFTLPCGLAHGAGGDDPPQQGLAKLIREERLVFAAQDVISQPRVCHSTTMAAFVH